MPLGVVEGSKPDAGGDDATESFGAGVSSHPETCAYDCGSDRERRNPVRATGEALHLRPSEDHDGIKE